MYVLLLSTKALSPVAAVTALLVAMLSIRPDSSGGGKIKSETISDQLLMYELFEPKKIHHTIPTPKICVLCQYFGW